MGVGRCWGATSLVVREFGVEEVAASGIAVRGVGVRVRGVGVRVRAVGVRVRGVVVAGRVL